MRLIGGQRGLTLIETIATAAIVAFVVLGLVNLIGTVYRNTVSTKASTTAFEIAMDNIETYRGKGFDALQVNPSGANTFATEQSTAAAYNNYYYDTLVENNTNYTIYRTIKYANEDSSGDIVPIDLQNGQLPLLKTLTVDVQYYSIASSMTKTVEEVAYVSNRNVPMAGSSITGTLSAASGPALTVAANPYVYVTGHPELTVPVTLTACTYLIENLQPGSYILYASANGYKNTTYTSNPVVITNTVQAPVTANIALVPIDSAILTGTAFVVAPTPVILYATCGWNTAAALTLDTGYGTTTTVAALYAADPLGSSTVSHVNVSPTTLAAGGNVFVTDFADGNPSLGKPVQVFLTLNYATIGTANSGDVLKVSICNDTTQPLPLTRCVWTSNWGSQQPSNPFRITTFANTASTLDYFCDVALTLNANSFTIDITPMFDEGDQAKGWTWLNINRLGIGIIAANRSGASVAAAVTSLGLNCAYLSVYYQTGLGNNNTSASANDGTSTMALVDSQSRYTIPTSFSYPAPAVNTITASALMPPQFGGPLFGSTRTNLTTQKGQVKTVNFALIPLAAGTGILSGKVINGSTNAGLSGVTVVFTSDASGTPYSFVTDANGNFSSGAIPTGAGILSASLANYKLQTSLHPVVPSSGLILVMFPIGTASGTVKCQTTNAAPVPPVEVDIRSSGGQVVDEVLTDASGNFTLTATAGDIYELILPAANLQTNGFTWITPANGIIPNVNLIGAGSSTSGKNFTIDYSFQTINGTVKFDNVTAGQLITDGGLVIAQPSSNTIPPYGVSGGYFSVTVAGTMQDSYYRTVDPSYACEVREDGTYRLLVPVGQTYTIYAFYTADAYSNTITSTNSAVPKFSKTMTNYYKTNTSVSPGTASNFTGSWLTY